MNIYDILNILLTPLVTLAAGLIAFVIYKQQKRDTKRNAANLLTLEIQQAEAAIDWIRKSENVDESVSVLPQDSWSINHHLFVNDFDYSQRVLITNFYSQCAVIEKGIKEYLDYMNISRQEKIRLTQNIAATLAEKYPVNPGLDGGDLNGEAYRNEINAITSRYFQESATFEPFNARQIINKYTGRIERISNTPVGEKLKKLAK